MYIIELKKWYGKEYHKKGLNQLGEYLEQYGLDEGYLLVFDFRKEKTSMGQVKEDVVIVNGKSKKIFGVFC